MRARLLGSPGPKLERDAARRTANLRTDPPVASHQPVPATHVQSNIRPKPHEQIGLRLGNEKVLAEGHGYGAQACRRSSAVLITIEADERHRL